MRTRLYAAPTHQAASCVLSAPRYRVFLNPPNVLVHPEIVHTSSICRSHSRPHPTTYPRKGKLRIRRGSFESRYHRSSSNRVPVPHNVGCWITKQCAEAPGTKKPGRESAYFVRTGN